MPPPPPPPAPKTRPSAASLPPLPCSAPQWESCLNRTLCVDDYTTDLTCVWAAPLATVAQPAAPGSAAAAPGGVESEEDAPAPAFKCVAVRATHKGC